MYIVYLHFRRSLNRHSADSVVPKESRGNSWHNLITTLRADTPCFKTIKLLLDFGQASCDHLGVRLSPQFPICQCFRDEFLPDGFADILILVYNSQGKD